MKLKEYRAGKISAFLLSGFGCLLIAATVLVIAGFSIEGVLDMEHYNRVWQNPLSVDAVVASYDTYDDEGDTDYRSYIRYAVDGRTYDTQYEDRDDAEDLTPIGEEVVVEVSPEDPSRLISDLQSTGRFALVYLLMLCLLLMLVWSLIFLGKRSKQESVPDPETVRRDIVLTVIGRKRLAFWLLFALGCWLLVWRYPPLFGTKTAIVGSICTVIWGICLINAIRVCMQANRGAFEVRRDVLVEKEIISSSDDPDTYQLVYRSEATSKNWKTNTSEKNYHKARIGDRVQAVYMPGKKKPILHYNASSDAV